MKIALTIIAIAVFASTTFAADKYVNDTFGYEISSPEVKDFSGVYQSSMFYLPVVDGFGANVNIQVQEFEGTLEDYEKLSKDQFKQAGIRVMSSKISGDILTLEYAGKLTTYEMHWYARAIKRGQRIYLATATSLETRWSSQGPILLKSVDSFKLK
jgi:hypothetical protein